MNAAELICKAIIEGTFTDAEVSAVVNAINTKIKLRRAQNRAIAAATIRVGMKIRIKNIKPKYLQGCEGEVVRIEGRGTSHATVKITRRSLYCGTRVAVGQEMFGIPFVCMDIIESEPTLTPVSVIPMTDELENPNALVEFMTAGGE